MIFLNNTPENEEFFVVCMFPSFPSRQIEALAPLNMLVTKKVREEKL